MSPSRKLLHISGLVVTLLLASMAVSYAATGSIPLVASNASAARAVAARAAGSLTITDSAGGGVLFDASNMAPGEQRAGVVTITNSGSLAGDFTLTASNVNNSNPAQPFTSVALLQVQDITTPASPVTLYAGTAGAMPALSLGTFAGGESHQYRFVVTFPNGTAITDNPLQGEVSTIDSTWGATAPDDGSGGGSTGGGTDTTPVGGAGGAGVGDTGSAPGAGTGAGTGGGTQTGGGKGNKVTIKRVGTVRDKHSFKVRLTAAARRRVKTGRVDFIVSCGRYCIVHFDAAIRFPSLHSTVKLRRVNFIIRAGAAMRLEIHLAPRVKAALIRSLRHRPWPTITGTVIARAGRLGARPHRKVTFSR